MKIILVRHFKVGFRWKRFCSSGEYETGCEGYNTSAVIQSEVIISPLTKVITSTMVRAIETSRYLFGKDPDLMDDSLCEVPIKPFMKTNIPIPKVIWDVIGRLQWRFGIGNQPETFAQSKTRVRNFTDKIISMDEDVVIVAHGWVIKLMIAELRRNGFKGPRPLLIRNGKPYEFVNDR